MYVTEQTVVQPECQAYVPLRTPAGNWLIDSGTVKGGLLAARVLLNGESNTVSVLVLNLNDKAVTVNEGILIGEAGCINDDDVAEKPTDHGVRSVADMTDCSLDRNSPPIGRNIPASDDISHLQVMIDGLPNYLTEHERQEAITFIRSRADAFSQTGFDVVRTSLVPHRINTGTNCPVKQQLRRHPHAHLEFIDSEVNKMLANDITEESASPSSSNVVLVAKKGGKLRFCIDYRKVNSLTYKDSYPIPKIDSFMP